MDHKQSKAKSILILLKDFAKARLSHAFTSNGCVDVLQTMIVYEKRIEEILNY